MKWQILVISVEYELWSHEKADGFLFFAASSAEKNVPALLLDSKYNKPQYKHKESKY